MKALSVEELQNLALELKTLEGARLQEVRLSPPLLLLGFFNLGEMNWVGLDLDPVAPQVLGFTTLNGLKLKDEKKPLVLFLRAHFVGHRLHLVTAPLDLGRVLRFHFQRGAESAVDAAEIEVRLFPRGQNILLRAGGKELALAKPQPLRALESVPEVSPTAGGGILISKTTEWRESRSPGRKNPGPDSVGADKAADAGPGPVEKKFLKAIEKASADLNAKRSLPWGAVGEWLKLNGSLANPPEEFAKFLDLKKNFSWNLENVFHKAKESKDKILGGERRLAQLQADLAKVRSGQAVGDANPKQKTKRVESKAGTEIRGRTYELGDGMVLFVGKSAQDNLRLLREAKAWDLWLHLRDVPSCHGILRRNKNQNVSDSRLHEAAHFLIAKNFGDKHKDHDGDRFDVLVVECRFVRPIKGDKVGRVTYSDERVFTHRFAAKNS